MTIKVIAIIFIGLSSGLSVGGGFVAFLTVLGIIPRLTQLTKTVGMIRWYEQGVVLGSLMGVYASLRDPVFGLSPFILIFLGTLGGIFVGLVAGALTEVLNVIPILAKRLNLDGKIITLLMAVVFGKIFGSIFQWVYFIKR